MFTATVVNIRPLDGATVETDIRQYIRQHPNKHVYFPDAISRQYIIPVLLPAAGTLSMSRDPDEYNSF